jgi:hypothetical protein
MTQDDKDKKNTTTQKPINTNLTVDDVGKGVITGAVTSLAVPVAAGATVAAVEISGATGLAATVVGGAATGVATAGFLVAVPVVIITAPLAVRNERIYQELGESWKPTQELMGIKAKSVTERTRLKELGAVEDAEGNFDLYHPDNTDKLEQAIRERKARYEELMKKHDSWIPRFIRSGDKANEYNAAWVETLACDAALKEFPAFRLMVQTVHKDRMKQAEEKAGKSPHPKEITPKEMPEADAHVSLPAIFNGMKSLPTLAAA